MAKTKRVKSSKRSIEQYSHADKTRVNNPPVGLVTPDTDQKETKRTYAYDPHLDPSLQWAGKTERISFEVPTLSLHVHERIDPRSILEAVRKKNGSNYEQLSMFSSKSENPPLREAIEFYKHAHGWSNRLIAGDSLLVMTSLLEKEGMERHVQMIYFDPPYGIRYGSNFQPFVNNRDVKDGKDEDLTAEPEMIKAFRDTWELGLHSYLSYLRDRILLARELLAEAGSIFVQISDENVHHVREILDEVFRPECHVVDILVKKKGSQKSSLIDPVNDYLLWYSKTPRDAGGVKFRTLFARREMDSETLAEFRQVQLRDGREFPISKTPTPDGEVFDYRLSPRRLLQDYPDARLFRAWPITNGGFRANQMDPVKFGGRSFNPPEGRCWSYRSKRQEKEKISPMERLGEAGRLCASGKSLDGKRYLDDFPFKSLSNWWDGLGGAADQVYVVQTNPEIVARCLLMTTDPGDLVLDITCGSGTTAFVAEQWGRRWITCDTSRVATALAKQRLMAAVFDYYHLAHPDEGVSSGFRYKTAPHLTLAAIANNEAVIEEPLYDRPVSDSSTVRVTGPFTVEAVPAPTVRSLYELEETSVAEHADNSIARSGATLRQDEWTSELLRTGVRGKGGQRIEFTRLEPLPGTRYLNADAETKGDKPQRVVVSFGPEHAPLEQRQVALALEEAQSLVPKPKIVLFAAFQFDPEASKDIDETNWPGVTLLKAQMNADLLTEDLKKKRSSNESFWLIGQPDIEVEKVKKGEHEGEFIVSVGGFDYYNTKNGTIESGGVERIAMWLLDTDYDGRSLFPRQVFFPMAGDTEGWARLAKSLHAEIDEGLIEAYRGTKSLPFPTGKNKRVAVKIIDDRGIESLRILDLK
jgi:adenine-specific DNA-methyltransferase